MQTLQTVFSKAGSAAEAQTSSSSRSVGKRQSWSYQPESSWKDPDAVEQYSEQYPFGTQYSPKYSLVDTPSGTIEDQGRSDLIASNDTLSASSNSNEASWQRRSGRTASSVSAVESPGSLRAAKDENTSLLILSEEEAECQTLKKQPSHLSY